MPRAVRRSLALVGALTAPWWAPWGAAPGAAQQASFEDAIDVRRLLVDVRVIGASGEPLLGLGPDNFRVRLDGVEVEVEAVDWSGAEAAAPGSAGAPTAAEVAQRGPGTPGDGGRQVVLFFQRDLLPSRAEGLMRMLHEARRFIARLEPGDRAAVVSYGPGLQLHCDLTGDRERLLAALDTVMPLRDPPAVPSLAPLGGAEAGLGLDRQARGGALSVEHALALVAEGLEPLAGAKSLLFFGWGLGELQAGAVRPRPGYARAAAAMARGEIAFFALDVTQADHHTLEALLQSLARATGGLYLRTFDHPGVAMSAAAAAVAGHYRLTLVVAASGRATPRLSVRLAGRRGTVLHRDHVAIGR